MPNVPTVAEGTRLFTPSPEAAERSRMRKFARWVEERHGLSLPTYVDLHRWSVTELETFWEDVARFFDVKLGDYAAVLTSRDMPGCRWFPGAKLNYAETALRRTGWEIAVISHREGGPREVLSWDELRDQVARARAGLRRLGVRCGDRVAAYLPNSAEALVAFLAAASLGATWSSCSPEFGVESVLDRFGQIDPKVLLVVDGYVYGGKRFDRAAEIAAIRSRLPGLSGTVVVPRLGGPLPEGALSWSALLAEPAPLVFDAVPFEHPLWILYSSGTTGLPKPIVQGHGGILLEHLKSLGLHSDLGEGDRFFWFSTTGWMMWNYLVSGLAVGSAIVLFEGNPGHPDLGVLWKMAERERVTYFGTSAPFLLACQKAGLLPKATADLSSVRTIGSTGAPLPVEGFAWVYEAVKEDVLLASVAGGTDVCTAFETSCPWLPVHAGELQCHALGAAVEAFDATGKAVVGELGELVITLPMPSMPLHFLNDPDGKRLRESYFADFPGVWRHGDWIKITPRGGSIIYGRSDSTLNRGGVRMGTSEFYRVVEALPEVSDSLVVDTGSLSDEGKLYLFVVPASPPLTEADRKKIRTELRSRVSPRHVPDEILEIREVPRTLNGKKVEVPIKRVLMGMPRERAVNAGTLANPGAVEDVLRAAPSAS
ncbi:MAG TPA: acetoacetate--CoA ligase [Polyangiaceae bacterium]|nr:acetoacetate--CoA ligase [Polyangiaceae bacterium]